MIFENIFNSRAKYRLSPENFLKKFKQDQEVIPDIDKIFEKAGLEHCYIYEEMMFYCGNILNNYVAGDEVDKSQYLKSPLVRRYGEALMIGIFHYSDLMASKNVSTQTLFSLAESYAAELLVTQKGLNITKDMDCLDAAITLKVLPHVFMTRIRDIEDEKAFYEELS